MLAVGLKVAEDNAHNSVGRRDARWRCRACGPQNWQSRARNGHAPGPSNVIPNIRGQQQYRPSSSRLPPNISGEGVCGCDTLGTQPAANYAMACQPHSGPRSVPETHMIHDLQFDCNGWPRPGPRAMSLKTGPWSHGPRPNACKIPRPSSYCIHSPKVCLLGRSCACVVAPLFAHCYRHLSFVPASFPSKATCPQCAWLSLRNREPAK